MKYEIQYQAYVSVLPRLARPHAHSTYHLCNQPHPLLSFPFLKKAPSNLSEKRPINYENEKNCTASQLNQKSGKIPHKTHPEDLNLTNPSRIITLHQPLTCIDYDGPGKNLAHHMAKYCDLPVRKLGAMPGSLGSYAGLHLNIPTITPELPGRAEKLDSKTLWNLYGTALIASVLYPDEPDTVLQAKGLTTINTFYPTLLHNYH